jgi:hypothetical protein
MSIKNVVAGISASAGLLVLCAGSAFAIPTGSSVTNTYGSSSTNLTISGSSYTQSTSKLVTVGNTSADKISYDGFSSETTKNPCTGATTFKADGSVHTSSSSQDSYQETVSATQSSQYFSGTQNANETSHTTSASNF